MKKFYRVLFYAMGCVVLAFGITLNTKAGLGVSPLISIPFAVSQISGWNFSILTFVLYSIFVIIQIILIRKKPDIRLLLQVPFSFVFSLFLELFGRVLDFKLENIVVKIVVLIIALMLTGAGVSMTVNMKYIPNPADGLAYEVGRVLKKDMGFGKNTIDCIAVIITCCIGLIFTGGIVAVGIGTVIAVILTGRFVKLFNVIFLKKMLKASGMDK